MVLLVKDNRDGSRYLTTLRCTNPLPGAILHNIVARLIFGGFVKESRLKAMGNVLASFEEVLLVELCNLGI